MIKLTWKFNGRTVPANRLGDEIAKAARSKMVDLGRHAIAEIRCPVHGTSPRNIRAVGSGSHLRYEYEFCCERLQQAVGNRFS